MSEGPLINVNRPIVPLKLDFAQKLFDNIPSNIVDRWELKKPDKDWNGISGFRFNKQELSAMYYVVYSKISKEAIIKYSLPGFKFEYVYPNPTEKDVNSKGYPVERRYDKDENMESEYVHSYTKGVLPVKTKSKDKEVYLPYIWGEDPKPLDSIDEIRPYLIVSPTRFEWYYKEDNPDDKYILFLLSTPVFKQNKK